MINSVAVSASFASSNFTLEGIFQPLTGITAVVGGNGKGKTFSTIETVRYLLYGTKALRGPASGYKDLSAHGNFTIRGEDYEIIRSPKRVEIIDAKGVTQAVGAEAVTAKVTELMGYGLRVFDVCNASVQGDTNLFGDMKPAERKKMLDEVVGLTSNETVEKACRAEATNLKREAEAMTKLLVTPVSPTTEFPGVFSDDLEAKIKAGRQDRKAYDLALASIKHPDKPVEPTVEWPSPTDEKLIADMESERLRDEYEAERLRKIIDAATVPMFSSEELEKAAARIEKRRLIEQAGERPTFTQAEVTAGYQLRSDHLNAKNKPEVECPNCAHHFKPGVIKVPDLPEWMTEEFLDDQQHRIIAWGKLTPDLPDGPDLTPSELATAYREARAWVEATKASTLLGLMPKHKDRSAQLIELRNRQVLWDSYLAAKLFYDRQMAENKKAQAALDKMTQPLEQEELDELSAKLSTALIFEEQFRQYDKQTVAYNTLSAEIADKIFLSNEYKKGGDALSDARKTIKAFLAPALSRTATAILYDMVGGELGDIHVNEDMDIMVGAQTLETLSGGQATAVNIALRIALGQVLVGDTFPVFLADEMDAYLDATKRSTLAEALLGLKSHLKQIILITHRDVDIADQIHSVD